MVPFPYIKSVDLGLLHCIIDTMAVLRAWERGAYVLFEEYILFEGEGGDCVMTLKEWLISYRVVDEDTLHVVEKAFDEYGVREVNDLRHLEDTDDIDHLDHLSLNLNTDTALRYILSVFNDLKIENLKKPKNLKKVENLKNPKNLKKVENLKKIEDWFASTKDYGFDHVRWGGSTADEEDKILKNNIIKAKDWFEF